MPRQKKTATRPATRERNDAITLLGEPTRTVTLTFELPERVVPAFFAGKVANACDSAGVIAPGGKVTVSGTPGPSYLVADAA